MTAAACWESAACWRWASSMACWICTFGSAYSSTFDENSAIRYFQALLNGFAMVNSSRLLARYGTPAHRRGETIVAGDPTSFHLPAVTEGEIQDAPGHRQSMLSGLSLNATARGVAGESTDAGRTGRTDRTACR